MIKLRFSKASLIVTLSFSGGSVKKTNKKKWPANAGDTGLIPGSGRPPVEGNTTHSSILAWGIPWIEELQSMGLQKE